MYSNTILKENVLYCISGRYKKWQAQTLDESAAFQTKIEGVSLWWSYLMTRVTNLTVDDIVKLDNACMSHKYRPQVMEKINDNNINIIIISVWC
jgi:hypothetical protein